MSTWKTLDAINVNEHKEKKGKFDYLSWVDAWTALMNVYPDSTHDMLKDVYYPDGTMEVRSSVTVEGKTLKCFLPVMDNHNKAIVNPDAFAINKARQRCLAKNIALFGLGLYIFRGEDLPDIGPIYTESQLGSFKALLAKGDGWAMKEFARDVGADVLTELFNAAPQGQKVKWKDAYRTIVGEANKQLRAYLEAISTEYHNGSSDSVTEIIAELTPVQLGFVKAGLTDIEHKQLEEMGIEL